MNEGARQKKGRMFWLMEARPEGLARSQTTKDKKVMGGPLASSAVTHYCGHCCSVTFVPTEYSMNVPVREHYGEFTPAGSRVAGYKYPCN